MNLFLANNLEMPFGDKLLGCAVIAAIFLIPVLVVRLLYYQNPQVKFRKVYRDISLYPRSLPGTVYVEFYTYDGFLVWFTQTKHAGYLVPDQARVWLKRLLRYNFVWGLLCAGAIFVPILSLFNYWRQSRLITKQEQDLLIDDGWNSYEEDETFTEYSDGTIERDSYSNHATSSQAASPKRGRQIMLGVMSLFLGFLTLVGSLILLTEKISLVGTFGLLFVTLILGIIAYRLLEGERFL